MANYDRKCNKVDRSISIRSSQYVSCTYSFCVRGLYILSTVKDYNGYICKHQLWIDLRICKDREKMSRGTVLSPVTITSVQFNYIIIVFLDTSAGDLRARIMEGTGPQ